MIVVCCVLFGVWCLWCVCVVVWGLFVVWFGGWCVLFVDCCVLFVGLMFVVCVVRCLLCWWCVYDGCVVCACVVLLLLVGVLFHVVMVRLSCCV